MPRIDRDDPGAESDAWRDVRVRGQGEERVAADPVGHPEAVVAERVPSLGEGQGHAEIGAGPDPLLLVEHSPERRVAAGESALLEAEAKLVGRAAARRDMARLEEMVVKVLPRLLLADRRLVSVRPS